VKRMDELRSSLFSRRSAPLIEQAIRSPARRGALSVLHDAGLPDIVQARGEGLKPTLEGLGGCEMSSFRTRCSAD
jgi:hypothetical protein